MSIPTKKPKPMLNVTKNDERYPIMSDILTSYEVNIIHEIEFTLESKFMSSVKSENSFTSRENL